MPQSKKHNLAYLTFEIAPGADGAVPGEAHLLPPGPFRAEDGRPVECEAWQLDGSIAARLISLAASKKTDMLVDYEHQSLRAGMNGKPVPAAGWCPNTLEWRDGKGLYAVNITWTGKAQKRIAGKEYRYISTVFAYNPKTGEVTEIISFALTNTPALDGLDALADLVRGSYFSTTGVDDMPDDKQVAALTAERDGLNQKVAALTAEKETLGKQVADLTSKNTELTGKVAGFEKEKAEAALAAEKAKRDELMAVALTIVPPAEKPFLETLSLAQLTSLIETKKPLALLSKQADGKGSDGTHGLSADELAVCSRAGLTPEEFANSKKQ